MVLVFVIAVAWIVILGPSMIKRRSRTVGSVSSVSHFHRALRTLEHSSPEPIVAPAYRLRSVSPPGAARPDSRYPRVSEVPVLTVVGADQLPRPALAFLGDPPPSPTPMHTGDRFTDDTDDSDDTVCPGGAMLEYRRVDGLVPGDSARQADIVARRQTVRRRRDTLGLLMLVFVVTLMIGFLPGAAVAWIVTAVAGVATAGYMALLVQLRRAAEERDQKLRYLGAGPPAAGLRGRPSPVPVAMSGRYAHPSNQAAVAR